MRCFPWRKNGESRARQLGQVYGLPLGTDTVLRPGGTIASDSPGTRLPDCSARIVTAVPALGTRTTYSSGWFCHSNVAPGCASEYATMKFWPRTYQLPPCGPVSCGLLS